MTGVLAGYTYIITVVPVNILGDGYPNKTIGYLNIIIKFVMFTSHTVIIPEEPTITSTSFETTLSQYHSKSEVMLTRVVTTPFNESNQCFIY